MGRRSGALRTSLSEHCAYIGGDGAGRLLVRRIDLDLSDHTDVITSEEEYLASLSRLKSPVRVGDGESLYPEERAEYLFCRLASYSGQTFAPRNADVPVDATPAWATAPEAKYDDLPALATECLEQDNNPEVERQLKALVSGPDAVRGPALWTLQEWERSLTWRKTLCGLRVQQVCRYVSTFRGRAVLSYVTEACAVRRVTASDVKNDVSEMERARETEAEILRHTTILDTLNFCEKAIDNSRGVMGCWRTEYRRMQESPPGGQDDWLAQPGDAVRLRGV